MKRGLILFLVCAAFSFENVSFAQPTHFTTNKYWKHQRKEIIFGIGASNFLGDLGGLNRIGTDYSPMDIDFAVTRPSGHFGIRYRLKPWISNSVAIPVTYVPSLRRVVELP